MQAAAGNKRKVRAVRLVLPRFDFPLEVKGATQGLWVPESGWPLPRPATNRASATAGQAGGIGYMGYEIMARNCSEKISTRGRSLQL